MQQGPEVALALVTLTGGPSVVDPGQKQQVTLDLRAGNYVLLCFVADDEDGLPHLAKGMIKPIEVVARATKARFQEPQANLTISLHDFSFTMPKEVKAGQQVWKVINEGPQPHEMVLIKLADGKTLQDVEAFLRQPVGPPPFTDAGGMQGLAQDTSGWLWLDLQPGEYVALCHIPDPASGLAHTELGMVQSFVVK